MKKIILGAALVMAFSLGMGDVSALGKDNKTTIATLEQGYATPDGDASAVKGLLDEVIRDAATDPSVKVNEAILKKARDAAQAIADMKKLTGVGSINSKVATFEKAKALSNLNYNALGVKAKQDIDKVVKVIRERQIIGQTNDVIERFYAALLSMLTNTAAVQAPVTTTYGTVRQSSPAGVLQTTPTGRR